MIQLKLIVKKKQKTKKTTTIKDSSPLIKILAIIIAVVIIIVVGFLGMFLENGFRNIYCERHPSPIMDDYCFDFTLRCELECGSYDLNYTGNTEGCACDCGNNMYVSACSGFLFERS